MAVINVTDPAHSKPRYWAATATSGRTMSGFSNASSKNRFHAKLWRGERMCLAGTGVDAPEDDLVGFSLRAMPPTA